MKAKYFKKIRERMKPYIVDACGGDTFGYHGGYKTHLLARNAEEAIRRFCQKYRRKHKERFKHERISGDYNETTRQWQCFCVEDEKGFTTYWT